MQVRARLESSARNLNEKIAFGWVRFDIAWGKIFYERSVLEYKRK